MPLSQECIAGIKDSGSYPQLGCSFPAGFGKHVNGRRGPRQEGPPGTFVAV